MPLGSLNEIEVVVDGSEKSWPVVDTFRYHVPELSPDSVKVTE